MSEAWTKLSETREELVAELNQSSLPTASQWWADRYTELLRVEARMERIGG